MNWGGPGPLVFDIVVSYCCKRKMLRRNWNWKKTIGFFVKFLSLAKFRLERGPGPLPPLGHANAPIETNEKGVRKFSARFLVFYNKISMVKKIVLSSSRGQDNFRGPTASRPRPRTWKCVLEDVLETKDVLEDSTSDVKPPPNVVDRWLLDLKTKGLFLFPDQGNLVSQDVYETNCNPVSDSIELKPTWPISRPFFKILFAILASVMLLHFIRIWHIIFRTEFL